MALFKNSDEQRDAQRRLGAYDKPLLGLQELAFVLGRSKQDMNNIVKRNSLYSPDKRLKMGPIWLRETVADYIKEGYVGV